MEAGVCINHGGAPFYWHLPADRSAGALPDSRTLWNVLWDNMNSLAGFAHSHPGGGIPGPSGIDITTFAAIESGLDCRLKWWITSSERTVLVEWKGPGRLDYSVALLTEEPDWVEELRRVSVDPDKQR